MSESRISFCDHCNEDQFIKSNGRGYAFWSEGHCIAILGWKRTEQGVQCVDCQNEEATLGKKLADGLKEAISFEVRSSFVRRWSKKIPGVDTDFRRQSIGPRTARTV